MHAWQEKNCEGRHRQQNYGDRGKTAGSGGSISQSRSRINRPTSRLAGFSLFLRFQFQVGTQLPLQARISLPDPPPGHVNPPRRLATLRALRLKPFASIVILQPQVASHPHQLVGTAFSLLVLTEQPHPTRLFLKKSRTSLPCPVQSRSENALVTPSPLKQVYLGRYISGIAK
jgi:hypothetical protein